ncbi:AraC family transcriptional regulator [Bacillus sp. TS-2]|nr:AraC family transcriptional regulator [Bacillus sp. TS-2]
MLKKYHVGILLFDYVDALDFSGPYEVFNLTTYEEKDVIKLFANKLENKPFSVSTVSRDGNQITVHNGLRVQPDYSFLNAPHFDIIIVPGGPLRAMKNVEKNEDIINWIKSYENEIIASVCTGAFFLAKAGLLSGKKATTNRVALDMLEKGFPDIDVIRGVKFVDEGNIVTSAGISAGIQMALYLVSKLFDKTTADRTAYTIELD